MILAVAHWNRLAWSIVVVRVLHCWNTRSPACMQCRYIRKFDMSSHYSPVCEIFYVSTCCALIEWKNLHELVSIWVHPPCLLFVTFVGESNYATEQKIACYLLFLPTRFGIGYFWWCGTLCIPESWCSSFKNHSSHLSGFMQTSYAYFVSKLFTVKQIAWEDESPNCAL